MRLLAGYFRKTDALVTIEPHFFDTVRSKPDLEIVSPYHHLMVDVVVTTPSAPSYHAVHELAAADSQEAKKVSSYGQLAARRGAKCFGFALESFGAWGRQATQVLSVLESMMSDQAKAGGSIAVTKMRMIQVIAIALQAWNAKLCDEGTLRALDAEQVRLAEALDGGQAAGDASRRPSHRR